VLTSVTTDGELEVTDLADVTEAINVLVNVSVEVGVELGRRRKERQTYSNQLPAERGALPTASLVRHRLHVQNIIGLNDRSRRRKYVAA